MTTLYFNEWVKHDHYNYTKKLRKFWWFPTKGTSRKVWDEMKFEIMLTIFRENMGWNTQVYSLSLVVIKWERHPMSIWTLFVKLFNLCKANLLFFWCLYRFVFHLETIGVSLIIIWWQFFEKRPFQLKLRHCEKATKFEKLSHFILKLLSNFKTKREIFSDFCGPLEKPEL